MATSSDSGSGSMAAGRQSGGVMMPSSFAGLLDSPQCNFPGSILALGRQFGIASKSHFSFCIALSSPISIPPSLDPPGSMIVCSCNVISDQDIRHAVSTADELPRNAKEVYGCLGCSAACGRCARTIKTIVDEALGPCARQCQDGCVHDRTSIAPDELTQERFALAAA